MRKNKTNKHGMERHKVRTQFLILKKNHMVRQKERARFLLFEEKKV